MKKNDELLQDAMGGLDEKLISEAEVKGADQVVALNAGAGKKWGLIAGIAAAIAVAVGAAFVFTMVKPEPKPTDPT